MSRYEGVVRDFEGVAVVDREQETEPSLDGTDPLKKRVGSPMKHQRVILLIPYAQLKSATCALFSIRDYQEFELDVIERGEYPFKPFIEVDEREKGKQKPTAVIDFGAVICENGDHWGEVQKLRKDALAYVLGKYTETTNNYFIEQNNGRDGIETVRNKLRVVFDSTFDAEFNQRCDKLQGLRGMGKVDAYQPFNEYTSLALKDGGVQLYVPKRQISEVLQKNHLYSSVGAFTGSAAEREYIPRLQRDLDAIVLNGQRTGLSLFD